MSKLNFKLEIFEGPLDLLLSLISKHKLNIYDIEISILLEQYLDYIEKMKMADLEVASEFLEMAAHLVYIKTVSLLPRHEESKKLKKELEGRLLEYKLCKEIANNLNSNYLGTDIFVRKQQQVSVDKEYNLIHSKEILLKAYLINFNKNKPDLPKLETSFSGIVSRRMVSVTSRILFVLKKLYKNDKVPYNEFFSNSDRSELVATFLAMLELVKSRRIVVSDDNKFVYFNKQVDVENLDENNIELEYNKDLEVEYE